MIGFDRPIKPEWIYNLLKEIKIGTNPSEYNKIFENIAKELTGKEGKRKARTIIFRSFIYSFQQKRTSVKNNIFLEWVGKYTECELRPLFLVKLMIDHEVLRFITKKIPISYDSNGYLSSIVLTKKMLTEHGDRDVVKRSVRSFLKTLCDFGVIEEIQKSRFNHLHKIKLDDEQTKNFLILYSKCYINSGYLDLNNIDAGLTNFLELSELRNVANIYNNQCWSYIRDSGRSVLMMKE